MITETRVDCGGLMLNLAQLPGQGSPLVFLHGVARCWQDYLTLFPPLAHRRELCAVDFRGHGLSDRATSYRVMDYADDIVHLLEGGLSDQPVILFGHSLGGNVAVAVAARAPERVGALILEDPPLDLLGRNVAETFYHGMFVAFRDLARSTKPIAELTEEIGRIRIVLPGHTTPIRLADVRDAASLRFSARCIQRIDPEVFTPIIEGRWMEGFATTDLLASVRQPTLLLRGEYELGGVLSDADAARAASLLHDCISVKLPQVGHLIHLLQTEATIRMVTHFVESL